MSAIRDIAAILSLGSFSSTYKHALLRALVEFTMERPDSRPEFGWHLVPAVWLARRFIRYYWQLTELGIPQNRASGLSVRRHIDAYCARANSLLIPRNLASVQELEARFDAPEPLPDSEIELLYAIRNQIMKYPVRHVQNLRDEQVGLFSVLLRTRTSEGRPVLTIATDYKAGLRSAQLTPAEERRLRHFSPTWDNLLTEEFAFVALPERVFQELSEARALLRETISMRWLERSIGYAGAEVQIRLDEWTRGFLELDVRRDDAAIKRYRDLYEKLGLDTCIYTGAKCERGFPIDHVLPFRYFPTNAFWNLVPIANASLNSSKSDRLPLLDGEVKKRLISHVETLTRADEPIVRVDIARALRAGPENLAESEVASAVMRHIESMHHRLRESVPGRLWSA